MSQKGFASVYLLIGIVFLVTVGGGAYYYLQNYSKGKFDNTPSSKSGNFPELKGFPVYPGSIFIESGMSQVCNPSQQLAGLKVCDNAFYQWATTDDFDRVGSWYAEATKRAGWKCNGGAGQYISPRDATAFGNSCTKIGVDPYELSYSANSESTKIALEVLRGSSVQNQPNETTNPNSIGANWKTYTNTTYSYQVKYPANLIVKEQSDNVSFELNDFPKNVEFPSVVTIGIYKNPDNLSTTDFIQKNIGAILEEPKVQQVKINNLNGIRLVLSGATDNDNVVFQHKGFIYIISVSHGLIEATNISTEIFNQILSTFKFTQ